MRGPVGSFRSLGGELDHWLSGSTGQDDWRSAHRVVNGQICSRSGADIGTAPSMVKLFCSEMVGRIADRAVQILGGAGLIRGALVERFYRDVRHYRIGEGTSEVQRMLIARELLR